MIHEYNPDLARRYGLASIMLGIVQAMATVNLLIVLVIATVGGEAAPVMWWLVSLMLATSAVAWYLWWRYYELRMSITLDWYLDRVHQLAQRRSTP